MLCLYVCKCIVHQGLCVAHKISLCNNASVPYVRECVCVCVCVSLYIERLKKNEVINCMHALWTEVM